MHMRTVLATTAAAAAVLLTAPAANAATSTTTTQHQVTVVLFDSYVRCVGAADSITLTFNVVDHETLGADGRSQSSETQTGTFDTQMTGGGTSSGMFTQMARFNQVSPDAFEGTFIFNARVTAGIGAGSSFHENDHGTLNSTSVDPTVYFQKMRCS